MMITDASATPLSLMPHIADSTTSGTRETLPLVAIETRSSEEIAQIINERRDAIRQLSVKIQELIMKVKRMQQSHSSAESSSESGNSFREVAASFQRILPEITRNTLIRQLKERLEQQRRENCALIDHNQQLAAMQPENRGLGVNNYINIQNAAYAIVLTSMGISALFMFSRQIRFHHFLTKKMG